MSALEEDMDDVESSDEEEMVVSWHCEVKYLRNWNNS